MSKDAIRKVALKIFRDPTSATTDDARKLARSVLLLVDGKLPPVNSADLLSDAFKPLLERFPTALSNVYCFAECGPGWLPAIIPVLELCERDGVRVAQIKEKFGTLRISVDDGTEDVYAAIREAESIAARTCEECGAPGVLRRGGWLKTLCDECHLPQASRR